MLKTAIFRVDASEEMGGGHLSRCLTLAEKMNEYGISCIFVCKKGSGSVIPLLQKSVHEVHEVESDISSYLFNLLEKIKPNILIFDHYGIDAEIEKKCEPYTNCILCIDDVPVRKHYCDILIDQTIGRENHEYNGLLLKENVKKLLGAKYALIKPGFLEFRKSLEERPRTYVNRIFVNFGAFDLYGNCIKAATAGIMAGIKDIDIAISSAASNLDGLKELTKKNDKNINLFIDADMPLLMSKADLAIGAAGCTALERCCLGLPTIISSIADNQDKIAESLHNKGAAINVEPSEKCFYEAIQEIIQSPNKLSDMSMAAYSLCDANGLDRVLTTLK